MNAVGTVTVLIWLYLLLFRGHFWRVGLVRVTAERLPASRRRIAVVIPARNEAAVIGRSVTSLLQQSCIENLHVFVVDDSSSDKTREVAIEAAAKAGKADKLTLLSGSPLPAGWSGKLWAVQQGIEAALQLQPEFLLLTDADIEHAPELVATLAAKADCEGYDLTSLMVRLECSSLAEKLLIPAFVFFFFKLYPPAWIAKADSATAGAAGGCILIRPSALERAGGIAAIRHEIIDDCALARAVKRSGGRVFLGISSSSVSIRSYGTFAEIGHMIARTAFNQLRHSSLLLSGSLLGLAVTYLAPLVLLFSGHPATMVLGGVAWLLMTVAYLPVVRFYGLSPLWALALPLDAAFYMGATVYSALNYWSGRGGQWKGRAQDQVCS